jgi:hypothetical protein
VLQCVVKSEFIPARLVISSLRSVFASCVFNDLQTLFPSASLQSEVTPCFSFASALVCNSRKSAHFPPFVFLHLHTLFHSFTKSDSPSLLFSVACALFGRNRGVCTPLPAFPHPPLFRYNLSPWLACRSYHPLRVPAAQTPDCALNFNEVLG